MADNQLNELKRNLEKRIKTIKSRISDITKDTNIDMERGAGADMLVIDRELRSITLDGKNMQELLKIASDVENLEDKLSKSRYDKSVMVSDLVKKQRNKEDRVDNALDQISFDNKNTRKAVDFLISEIIRLRKDMIAMKNGPIKLSMEASLEQVKNEIGQRLDQLDQQITQLPDQIRRDLRDTEIMVLETRNRELQNELEQIKQQLTTVVKPEEVAELGRRLAEIERLDLKEKIRSYDFWIDNHTTRINNLFGLITVLSDSTKINLEGNKRQIEALQNELPELKRIVQELRDRPNVPVQNNDQRLRDLDVRIDELNVRLATLEGRPRVGEPLQPDQQIGQNQEDIPRLRQDLEARFRTLRELIDVLTEQMAEETRKSNNKFGTIEQEVQRVQGYYGHYRKFVLEMDKRIKELEKNIVKGESLDALIRRVSDLEEHNREMSRNSDQDRQTLEKLRQQLNDLRTSGSENIKTQLQEINAKLAGIEVNTFRNLNQQIEDIVTLLDDHAQSLAQLHAGLDQGVERYADQQNDIDELKRNYQNNQARVQNLETRFGTLQGEDRKRQEAIAQLTQVIKAQAQENKKILDRLTAQINTLQQGTQTTNLDQLRTEFDNNLANMMQNMAQIRTNIQEDTDGVKQRLTRLEAKQSGDVTMLRQAIEAQVGALKEEIKKMKEAREQMRSLILNELHDVRGKLADVDRFQQSVEANIATLSNNMMDIRNDLNDLSGLPKRVSDLENKTVSDVRLVELEKKLQEAYNQMDKMKVEFHRWDDEEDQKRRVHALLAKGVLAGFGIYT